MRDGGNVYRISEGKHKTIDHLGKLYVEGGHY
jgi:hypothetical protein